MDSQRSLTSVEGNRQSLDGGAMFGNAPKALWSRWLECDELNRISFACRALLVRDKGRNILFETGVGCFFSPKMRERFAVVEDEHVLLRSLSELGLAPADIDIIVLSHLHFDHAGGLLTAYREGEAPALVFPKAQFLVGSEAWERSVHPHVRDRASFIPELGKLLEDSGRLQLVEGDTHPLLGEGFRFHISSGHTPGMMLSEIDMPDGPVLFAADLIPGRPWVHVPMSMGYDRFPEQLIDEKQELLSSLVSRGGRLFFTHDSTCALAAVGQDASGRFQASHPMSELRDLRA